MKARFAIWALAVTVIGIAVGAYCLLPLAPGNVIRDIRYVDGDSKQSHQLDVYVPAFRTFWEKPRPLIVWIHGGAWRIGNKSATLASLLPRVGYVAASINYRLTDEAKFPAQLEDVKSAVQYLRRHSAEFGIDSGKVGIWGLSAGGHLAALAGLSGNRTMDTERDPAVHSHSGSDNFPPVQAVCDWCGPTDFLTITDQADEKNTFQLKDADGPVARLLGGLPKDVAAIAKSASPVTFVHRAAPPFLIIHGAADEVVPPAQSKELAKHLTECGANVTLHIIPGAKHDFTTVDCLLESINFFDKHLKSH